jgi:hypothetical protein
LLTVCSTASQTIVPLIKKFHGAAEGGLILLMVVVGLAYVTFMGFLILRPVTFSWGEHKRLTLEEPSASQTLMSPASVASPVPQAF